jgi:hypothetical protein
MFFGNGCIYTREPKWISHQIYSSLEKSKNLVKLRFNLSLFPEESMVRGENSEKSLGAYAWVLAKKDI